MKLLAKVLLYFAILSSVDAFAWNNLGHMVIAHIAYERLKPQVRAAVDSMTADLAKEYPTMNNFLQLALWPDMLRIQQKIDVFNHWHYIDTPFSQDGTSIKNYFYSDNIVWAINHIKPLVASPHINHFERARLLAFLIHLVGDIHQPLHVSARFSVEHPNGDLGGNLFHIQSPTNLRNISLHKFWDDGLGLFDVNASMKHIIQLSSQISSDFPEQYFGKKITDVSIKNWVKEGFIIATTLVYSTPENKIPSPNYIEQGQLMTEQTIALSGYRLAYLLNSLLE